MFVNARSIDQYLSKNFQIAGTSFQAQGMAAVLGTLPYSYKYTELITALTRPYVARTCQILYVSAACEIRQKFRRHHR